MRHEFLHPFPLLGGALISLASGAPQVLIFVAAMFAGMYLFQVVQARRGASAQIHHGNSQGIILASEHPLAEECPGGARRRSGDADTDR